MTKTKSRKIIERLKHYYGDVDTELSYYSIYELTIAVILSAQTTDKQVNKVSPILFKKFPDFKSLSNASIEDVESIIKSVGLYKTKTRNIINLSKELVSKYDSILPDNFNELIKLSGIGRKSANVILSMGFKKPAFAVDTHILRIANRIGYINSSDAFKVEKTLMHYISKEHWIEVHLLFIKHGRNICSAKKPMCLECPIIKFCDFATGNNSKNGWLTPPKTG